MRTRTKFTKSPAFLKILSLFLALILWFFIAGEGEDVWGTQVRYTYSEIPLHARGLGEDLAVAEAEESVDITLQGFPQAFDGLTPADLEAYIELNGLEEGRHEVRIRADAPAGLSIVRISPSTTEVVLEEMVSKQISVESLQRGTPAEGMMLHQVDFDPEEVFVRGPRRNVQEVEKVVFPLDLEGAEEDLFFTATLYALDADGNQVEGVDIIPSSVEIMAEIGFSEERVSIVPQFTNNGDSVKSITLEYTEVLIRAPQEVLAGIDSINTETIDLSGRPTQFTEEVPLVFPDGVTSADREAVYVQILLYEEEEES